MDNSNVIFLSQNGDIKIQAHHMVKEADISW